MRCISSVGSHSNILYILSLILYMFVGGSNTQQPGGAVRQAREVQGGGAFM